MARHRGSAFGAMDFAQPAQIDFEHSLAIGLLKHSAVGLDSNILVEDESRLIGRCAIPEGFFKRMRASGLLYVEDSFDQRQSHQHPRQKQKQRGTANCPAASQQRARHCQVPVQVHSPQRTASKLNAG